METIGLILVVLAILLIAGNYFSKGKLFEVLGVHATSASTQAANALDDAVGRVEKAEADNESGLAKATSALVEIKGMRVAIKIKLDAATAEITKWDNAAQNAASIQKQELVLEALKRRNDASEGVGTLQTQYEFLLKKEGEVQKAVNALQTRKAKLKQTRVQIKTRAKTATTTLDVNQLLAGVDLTGNSKDIDRAFEIVDDLEAKSGAMAEIAAAATTKQDMDAQLEALSHPKKDVDAEAAELMTRFQKPS